MLTVFACGDDGGGNGTEGSSTGGSGSSTDATSTSTTEPGTTTSGAEGSGTGSTGEGSSTTAADGGSSSESGGSSSGGASGCEAQADEGACTEAMGCVWVGNAQNGVCLADDPSVCPTIEEMMLCQQHPACEWDNQAAACVEIM